MLEVRKNTFSRSYENTFFRDFSRELSKKFADKNINGLLIGSPFCEVEERLQIDALLITPYVICIIDFKNFSGQINLPNQSNFKQGIWTNATGDLIKGGSSINPYIQLSVQKNRFEKVLKYHVLPNISPTDTLNLKHADKVVCFQDAIELIGEIPSEYMNFHITDKVHFLEKIMDIIDVKNQTSLTLQSFEAFKKVFLADTYQFDEKAFEASNISVEPLDVDLQFNKLREDQRFALTQIDTFLKDPNKKIFILQGTLNSGKSRLIPYIRDLAYQSGIVESELFASSARVARNLIDFPDKVQSIYSYIYGGNSFFEDEKDKDDNLFDDTVSDNDQPEKRLKIIPLKKCDNESNTLFIVDEAHLLSDSYMQSIDMRFNSGHLLKDFLEFSELDKTNKKIIFIGDPYQLQIGGSEKSSLNPKYFEEKYSLDIGTVQLLDNEEFPSLNQQALKCVHGMRQQKFNSLNFIEDEHLSLLKTDEVVPIVTKIVHSETKCPILSYTNEEAQKINMWIKKAILRNGEDLTAGDLVTLHNNITIAGDSTSDLPVKIFNGEFATVEYIVDQVIPPEKVPTKKGIVELMYREISIKLHLNGKSETVLSLENFRLNPKAELSDDENRALLIHQNQLLREEIEKYPFEQSEKYKSLLHSSKYQNIQQLIENLEQRLNAGEKVKTKLDDEIKRANKIERKVRKEFKTELEIRLMREGTSKWFKYKNAAFIRFGWSMTVHRSMAYRFDEVIFNVDQGKNRGRNNEDYFRWIYSGLCRAKEHVFLRNFTPITPWDNVEINETILNVRAENVFFESDNPDITKRLEELKEYIVFKIAVEKMVLQKIEPFNWQERYFIADKNGHEIVLNILYDGRGHFRKPSIMRAHSDELKECVLTIFDQKRVIQSFDFIAESWRRDAHRVLSRLLKSKGIYIESIMQASYHDKMKLYRNNDELEIYFYYDGSGMFTKIFMRYCSEDSLWDDFKAIVEGLKIINESDIK